MRKQTLQPVQPLWLRITHWLNALAVLVMVTSGWQIYDASPIFKTLTFPPALTLGGWLGGAIQWHFAAMWLLAANFIVYLAMNVATGRLQRRMFPLSLKSVFADAYAAGETYLPEGMREPHWYQPTPRGLEGKIGEKLARLADLDAAWRRENKTKCGESAGRHRRL